METWGRHSKESEMHPWQVCCIVLFGMAIISCSLRLIKLSNRLAKLEKMLRDKQDPPQS
jgi:hypothetical protein